MSSKNPELRKPKHNLKLVPKYGDPEPDIHAIPMTSKQAAKAIYELAEAALIARLKDQGFVASHVDWDEEVGRDARHAFWGALAKSAAVIYGVMLKPEEHSND